jgi:hypothetical protein
LCDVRYEAVPASYAVSDRWVRRPVDEDREMAE